MLRIKAVEIIVVNQIVTLATRLAIAKMRPSLRELNGFGNDSCPRRMESRVV